MTHDSSLRAQLVKLLDSPDAHASFDAAVKEFPPKFRGVVPERWEYSAWQLVEHIRLAQADILEFSVGASYHAMKWPDDYWPKSPAPPSDTAWEASIESFRRDLKAMQQLAADEQIDLLATVPHGEKQTYLREILLLADHTAYHVGQLVALRRQLGIWPA